MTELWGNYRSYNLNDTKNIEPVAKRVKEILDGKNYIFLSCYEHLGWRPEIRMNQKMRNVTTWKNDGEEDKYGGFHVSDTYGVWGCMFVNDTNGKKQGYIALANNGLEVHNQNDFGQWYWWKVIVEEDGRE
jgi:hypothetical protein